MTHVMIDLETLDTSPTTVVLSCGMVEFDPNSGKVSTGHGVTLYPSIQEQFEKGRTVSESTLIWWLKRSDMAKADWLNAKRQNLNDFRESLRQWMSFMQDIKVWGNGSVFDIAILEHMLDYTRIPWKYYNIRDTRTLWDIHPYKKENKKETAHTALADAIDQAERVCEVWPK